MIADCETCERKQVPCFACRESQRAICFICQGDVADPYCELDGKREYENAMLRPIVEARDAARAKAGGDEQCKTPNIMSLHYIESMRVHVDEGGQLSHRNGLDLLAEVERLNSIRKS